jgi:hypothetical protein
MMALIPEVIGIYDTVGGTKVTWRSKGKMDFIQNL